MANQAITVAVHQLKQEHIRLCKELERVDEALSALAGLEVSAPGKKGKAGSKSSVAPKATRKRRKVSAAARKKMAEAAKARWAAIRAKKEKAAAKPATK
jgi:hypothetical protein